VAARGTVADADLARAYGALGSVFHVYEFFDAAEASYVNASRLAPGEDEWHHLLGYLYQQTGRLEEAADRYTAARRAAPRDLAAVVRLAEVSLRLNRLRDAREHFEGVIAAFPALARNGLGAVALREGRFQDAVEHFQAALALLPQAASIHYSLAMAFRGLGRLDDARAHLERRGSGEITVGDPIVERLQTLVRGERGLVLQGRRAYDAGQFDEAADAFRRAIAAVPASVTARVNLGLALTRLGDTDGAVEQFEAALRLDGGNVTARAGLGLWFAGQRRDREAVGHLQVAFDGAPGDVNVRRELMAALLRLGRRNSAIAVLERARSFSPDDEDTLVSLSILLAEEERYADAVVLLDEGSRRFPGRTATATTLARLLASSPDTSIRDGRRALDLAMKVYDFAPAPAHAETVALSLAELGRCDEAAEWLRRGVTHAERENDAEEAARLNRELPRYEASSCRPPVQ
jgi:tetratricopeptide (TPR) repeat protein